MAAVLVSACEAAPPPVITPPPSSPRSIPTLVASVGVAVAVASPSPTAPVVGAYPVLVRDRLAAIETALAALDAQFALLKQSPFRITQDDWRTATLARVDDVGAAKEALRALGARTGPDASLYSDVAKLLADLDFVVSEYHMAFDFDPDGSHLTRASRAEAMASEEVQSMLQTLRLTTR